MGTATAARRRCPWRRVVTVVPIWSDPTKVLGTPITITLYTLLVGVLFTVVNKLRQSSRLSEDSRVEA